MNNKPIKDLPDSVQRMVQNALNKQERREIRQDKSWLTKLEDMQTLLVAIENDATEVTLTVGTFRIKPSYCDNAKSWYLSPSDGRFVPCGHFTPFRLKSLIAQKGVLSE